MGGCPILAEHLKRERVCYIHQEGTVLSLKRKAGTEKTGTAEDGPEAQRMTKPYRMTETEDEERSRERDRHVAQGLTCLQAAMHYEEGDGAGRSSKPQSSSGPQGQRLPEQRGPLEGPLPDASSLDQEKEIMLLLGAKPALPV